MADPFSISSSAVGVISLSHIVCRGLFEYYSACFDSPDDVKTLVTSLYGLISALKMLHRSIDKKLFVADCSDAVENLVRMLDEVKKEQLSGTEARQSLWGRLGNASKTLLYPFHRSFLKKLQGFVREVCYNLSAATCLVQL